MQPGKCSLADEMIRMIEFNRAEIDKLDYGQIIFRAHQGRLIEVTAAKTLKLSAGVQLTFLTLKSTESE